MTATGASSAAYIRVGSVPLQAGGLAAPPGQNAPATGAVIRPEGYFYGTRLVSNNKPSPGSWNVIVEGNVCVQTLKPVAAYSDWGFGQAFTATGYINPAIDQEDLDCVGIDARMPQSNLLITNNIVAPGNQGIRFPLETGQTIADRLLKNVVVRGNTIFNTKSYGLYVYDATSFQVDLEIDNNLFDCDPYFQSTNRGPTGAAPFDGTWRAGTTPVAIFSDNAKGLLIRRNRFRNTCIVISQAGGTTYNTFVDNVIHADPAAVTTFSTSNKGVGVCPRAGQAYRYVIEQCDPASADFGEVQNSCPLDAGGIPTTGKYVAGHLVHNTAPAIAAGKVTLGWLRITTGSGHVSGTDWQPLVVANA